VARARYMEEGLAAGRESLLQMIDLARREHMTVQIEQCGNRCVRCR